VENILSKKAKEMSYFSNLFW